MRMMVDRDVSRVATTPFETLSVLPQRNLRRIIPLPSSIDSSQTEPQLLDPIQAATPISRRLINLPSRTVLSTDNSQIEPQLLDPIQAATPISTSMINKPTKDQRLNKQLFHLNNIPTQLNYKNDFGAIISQFPLQSTSSAHQKIINYLCVAETLQATTFPSVAVHIMFTKRINFKTLFLNNIFPSNYLYLQLKHYKNVINNDVFNDKIKEETNDLYVETSKYERKNDFKLTSTQYRSRQAHFAALALSQGSVEQGFHTD
ncbi:unnamed protein product [Didymodactylos carnosus]|uniref:Uncharacterized protein n=1 Tax=Didymodactylos carnosus TaxID=1234261 RepID=A0A815C3Q1_9BILA|nr:unnamed protein product [Didymodactylos carnosus]CAF4077866.1 unnamed protein product [Didymodactylos carnosus]